MSKLLSYKEALSIATKLTAKYGLPPPKIVDDNQYGSNSWAITISIIRSRPSRLLKWFKWPQKTVSIFVRELYASSLEDGLTKLQQELSSYDNRGKIAEQFREKFEMQEADAILEQELSR